MLSDENEKAQIHKMMVPMKSMIYMNSMAWLADLIKGIADKSDFSIEQVEAQVHKDLRYMLDQSDTTH